MDLKDLKPNQITVWLLFSLIEPRCMEEIIEQIGVDERSVYRYLAAIKESGTGIEIFSWSENGRRYYSLFPRHYKLIQIRVEEGKLQAILERDEKQLEFWFQPFGLMPAAVAAVQEGITGQKIKKKRKK